MSEPLKNRKLQIVVGACTAIYFVLVLVHLCPKSEWRTRLLEPIDGFWNYCRLDQNWALFSPTIRGMNYHTMAILTFADGTKMIYEPPRMNKLSIEAKWRDEKWRKLSIDSLPWEDFKNFWPDFARYLGRQYYNPENKPVAMTLLLWWIELPLPTKQIVPQTQLPRHSNSNLIFEYHYAPEDFR